MELALITAEKIVEMFLIMLVGIGIKKAGMVSKETTTQLSNVLLDVVIPCIILLGFQREFDSSVLGGVFKAAGLTAVSIGLGVVAIQFLIKTKGNPDAAVEKISAAYSNCAFIGIPMVTAVLGADSVIYVTAYIAVSNLFFWTHGILVMTGKGAGLRGTLKSLLQPGMLSVIVSLFLFANRILLPQIILSPLNLISGMNTPLAMMVAGMMLADSDILAALKRGRIYYILVLKLFFIPFLSLAAFAFIPAESNASLAVLIATACPSSASGALLAIRYHKDIHYASELFTLTTIFSLFTMPLIVLAAGLVL